MLDSSNSSLYDATKEWKEKAEDALQVSLARLLANNERTNQILSQNNPSISRIMAQTKTIPSQREVNQEITKKDRQKKQWTQTQLQEIDDQAEKEMINLTKLKQQQQEIFQGQLTEKNDVWDKVLVTRRAEAAKLRMMISKLSNEIAKSRSEAKSAIDIAKKQENENLREIRLTREKLIRQITDLTNDIQKEKIMFESENRTTKNSADSEITQKQEKLSRLQERLSALKNKHDEKEEGQKTYFKEKMQKIKELRALLEEKCEEKVNKQSEIMDMKKKMASMSRLICSRKDEASSYSRQINAMKKDNERIQEQLVKMNSSASLGDFQRRSSKKREYC